MSDPGCMNGWVPTWYATLVVQENQAVLNALAKAWEQLTWREYLRELEVQLTAAGTSGVVV